MRHLEFFTDHFDKNYYRAAPPIGLHHLIDFFWETHFDSVWKKYPKGFSDAQFANLGYTFIINLGNAFIMQVGNAKIAMKTDGFLPRYNPIECFHKPGNHLFGIKFRISPSLFEKKINFAEYKNYIFPLSYLLEESVIDRVKKANSFSARTKILSQYFLDMVKRHSDPHHPVSITGEILEKADRQNNFTPSLDKVAARYQISERTLQRYFEMCTGITGKQALQIMRIRKATTHLVNSPHDFTIEQYGYYDHSHFYKHLKQFLTNGTVNHGAPHLALLKKMHKGFKC